ncbi:MAG: hypothetical protein ABI462_11455 [Ignavibacteria bacterium]
MKNLLLILASLFFIYSNSYSQTWDRMLDGRGVWSLSNDRYGNIFAGGLTNAQSRVWRSANGGDSWDTVHIGSGQTMWDFGYDSQGTMYVANYSTGMLKSTDQGLTFSLIPSSVFNNKNLQGVECGNNGYIYATSNTGFFRSTNNGVTFNETALSGLNCLPLLVDIDSSNIVYVGVTGSTSIGFYRSTDYGLTFSTNLNPGKNGFGLVQKPNGELFMITTTSPYNFSRSADKGLTWTAPSNTAASQRGIDYSLSGNFFTSGNGGVFRSTDDGLTFNNFNFTTSATPILTVNYNSNIRVFAGTSGAAAGGVWRCTEGPGPEINVDLKVLMEGMYDASLNRLNRRDTVTLYLRDAVAPYRMRDSARGVIDSLTFSGLYNFSNAPSGKYYLVVKHFNSIETWSQAGGDSITADASVFNYDFTASSAKAYGNNLKLLGGKYCTYSGDVNQNGTVNLADIVLVFNDAGIFATGYLVTDINADNIVNLTDILITNNNSTSFVHKITP